MLLYLSDIGAYALICQQLFAAFLTRAKFTRLFKWIGQPRIRGEQIQLQQMLVNLITNAIDSMAATDGERVLSISSEVHHSGRVMVSVEDTGKGFEPSAVDRIFNPMFTTKTQGMGMGLSICRSIIEAHEGQLWVTADKGRGAIFHFTVPVDLG